MRGNRSLVSGVATFACCCFVFLPAARSQTSLAADQTARLAGSYVIGSVADAASCDTTSYVLLLLGDRLVFTERKNSHQHVERYVAFSGNVLETATIASPSDPAGTRYRYRLPDPSDGNAPIYVDNISAGRHFLLTKCVPPRIGRAFAAAPVAVPVAAESPPPAPAPPPPAPAVSSASGLVFASDSRAQANLPAPATEAASAATGPDGKIVRTVVADGLGSTVESAVQNAAENALKQVVGSLLDTEKQVERRSQIADGIRSETRNVTSKVREYSQGSIQSFEVLETSQEGAIVRVAAKVGVRVDDFRAYIKKAAEGTVTIGKGLFAQAAVEQQQTADKNAIFTDRIIAPIANNEGVSLEVGHAEKISSQDELRKICSSRQNYCTESDSQRMIDENDWYIFPVTMRIDLNLVNSLEQTISRIATFKKRTPNQYNTPNDTPPEFEHEFRNQNQFCTLQMIRRIANQGEVSFLNEIHDLWCNYATIFFVGRSKAQNIYFVKIHADWQLVKLFNKLMSQKISLEIYSVGDELLAQYDTELYVDNALGREAGQIFASSPSPRVSDIEYMPQQFPAVIAPGAGANETFYLIVKILADHNEGCNPCCSKTDAVK